VDLAALMHLLHVVLNGTLRQEHGSRQFLARHGAFSQRLLNLF
jgi:hypothetical protein